MKKRKFAAWFFGLWAIFWVYEFAVRNFNPSSVDIAIRRDLIILFPLAGIASIYLIYKMTRA